MKTENIKTQDDMYSLIGNGSLKLIAPKISQTVKNIIAFPSNFHNYKLGKFNFEQDINFYFFFSDNEIMYYRYRHFSIDENEEIEIKKYEAEDCEKLMFDKNINFE